MPKQNPCTFETNGVRCEHPRFQRTQHCQQHLALVVRKGIWSGRIDKTNPCTAITNGVRCKKSRVHRLNMCQTHLSEMLEERRKAKAVEATKVVSTSELPHVAINNAAEYPYEKVF